MHSRLFATTLVVAALIFSACKADPSTPGYWEKQFASAKSRTERVKIVEDLRKSKFMGPSMVPLLESQLGTTKGDDVKAAIARLLGEAKDPRAVSTLAAEIAPVSVGSDSNMLNKEIATALGEIGGEEAIPPLLQLLKAKDAFTAVAAIDALGKLKAKGAVDAISAIAVSGETEPYVASRAVAALGSIGDSRFVPLLIRAMFDDRGGVYSEACMALYAIGKPAADALVPVLYGQDKELLTWAQQHDKEGVALAAKAMQVLGDFHDSRAEEGILTNLNYAGSDEMARAVMRFQASDAAGRMRMRSAVQTLGRLMNGPVAAPVEKFAYARALSRIGESSVSVALSESATKGPWAERESAIRALGMLTDDPSLFDKLSSEEAARYQSECSATPQELSCHDMDEKIEGNRKTIATLKQVASAASECAGKADCWVKKFSSPIPEVRQRAALEVGRSKDASKLPSLFANLGEKNKAARSAFILACDWILFDVPAAKADAQKALPAIAAQLENERGNSDYKELNQDLFRLAIAIAR